MLTQPDAIARPAASQLVRTTWLVLCITVIVMGIDLPMMPKYFLVGDPLAWRMEARSILRSGSLAIGAPYAKSFGEPGQHFVENRANGFFYSKYGIGNSIASLPGTLIETIKNGRVLPDEMHDDLVAWNIYNLSLAALTAWVLVAISGLYTSRSWLRGAYVIACLFGGYLWYFQRAQSAELFQVLLFSTFFYFFAIYLRRLATPTPTSSGRSTVAILWLAWLALGILVLTRLVFAVLLLGPFLSVAMVLWQRQSAVSRRDLWRIATMLAIPSAAILAIIGITNAIKFGSPLVSGYKAWHPEYTALTRHWPSGVAGMLFSTRWSIFRYFPLLLLAVLGWWRFARTRSAEAILIAASFLPVMIAIGSIPAWRGEWTYGPRYMIYVLPVLAVPSILWAERLIERLRNRKPALWIMATIVAIGFGYSAWLTFQVNRFDFFSMYYIVGYLKPALKEPALHYLDTHVEGSILADLAAHEDDLEDSEWFQLARPSLTPKQMDAYKSYVHDLLLDRNLYWW